MSEPFLLKVDIRLLARQRREYHGEIDLQHMPRLASGLSSSEGRVEAEIIFGIDPQGIEYARGHATLTAHRICQRCLEPMNTPIRAHWCLGLVETELASQRLPDGYDAMVIPEDGLTLAELVEDELILSLPIVSMHDKSECAVQSMQFGDDALDDSSNTDTSNNVKANPFAILSSLKTKK